MFIIKCTPLKCIYGFQEIYLLCVDDHLRDEEPNVEVCRWVGQLGVQVFHPRRKFCRCDFLFHERNLISAAVDHMDPVLD